MKLHELDKEMAYRWQDEPERDQEFEDYTPIDRKALKRQKLKKRVKLAALVLVLFLLVSGVVAYFANKEKLRTRGMTLDLRNESLPIDLPPGEPQLRRISMDYRHGSLTFNPFIASTQTVGELNVVTNVTNPNYFAYTVRHPAILDVVMITDAFFCSQKTCFFIEDAYNTTFLRKGSIDEPWDLSKKLITVPLPDGMTFFKAQVCPYLDDNKCHIVMRNAEGKYHFGAIGRYTNDHVPFIKDVFGVVDFPPNLTKNGAPWELRAFERIDHQCDRLVIWHDNKLESIIIDHIYGKFFPTIIEDVDRDEVVELHRLTRGFYAVVVMKEERETIEQGPDASNERSGERVEGRMRTRVRLTVIKSAGGGEAYFPGKYFRVRGDTVIRHDELFIHNRPSAITVFLRTNIYYESNKEITTFEICDLTDGSVLNCFINFF